MSKIDLNAFASTYGGARHPENEMRRELDKVVDALREARAALLAVQEMTNEILGNKDDGKRASSLAFYHGHGIMQALASLDARFDFGSGE
jgi:hypothetical protein